MKKVSLCLLFNTQQY